MTSQPTPNLPQCRPDRVLLVSPLGQHGAAEEFGRRAALPGVDVLL